MLLLHTLVLTRVSVRLHGSAGEAQESARVADKVHWMASAGEGVVARSRSAIPPTDPSVICSIFHTHNLHVQHVTHESVREYTHTRIHVNRTFYMMFHNGRHFIIILTYVYVPLIGSSM